MSASASTSSKPRSTGRKPDPGLVAENEDYPDAMADQGGQVARMLRDSSWSTAEIQAWAVFRPLVDRADVRRCLYLEDGAWEGLFDVLVVPTLPLVPSDSPKAPRRRRCTTGWSGPSWCPVPANASAVHSPPVPPGRLMPSSPRWRGPCRPRRGGAR